MTGQNEKSVILQKILTTLGWLVLIAAGAVIAFSLLAPMGVWLGLWDFRTGFTVLRSANTVAAWVAVLGTGAGFIMLGASRSPSLTGMGRFGGRALGAAVLAGIVWFIPQSYRPPEGTPAIHDITTDTSNPPEFVEVLPLRGTDSNPVEYGTFGDMTPERQAELQAAAYPDIQPLYFDESPEAIFERALQAVEELGWDLVAADPDEGRIEATDTTFWFRFRDDVVIRIQADGDRTRLDARSTSRVGRSDVGKNAERLRTLFAELQAA